MSGRFNPNIQRESPMIEFELTEDHKALVQTVREFAQKEVAPYIKEWDEKQEFRPGSFEEDGRVEPARRLHPGRIRRRRL